MWKKTDFSDEGYEDLSKDPLLLDILEKVLLLQD